MWGKQDITRPGKNGSFSGSWNSCDEITLVFQRETKKNIKSFFIYNPICCKFNETGMLLLMILSFTSFCPLYLLKILKMF